MDKGYLYRIGLLIGGITLIELAFCGAWAVATDIPFLSGLFSSWSSGASQRPRTPWPRGTPSSLMQHRVGRDSSTKFFSSGELLIVGRCEAYSETLKAAKLRLESADRHSSLVVPILKQIVLLASVGYPLAILDLARFFRDGRYGLPQSEQFFDYLLSSLYLIAQSAADRAKVDVSVQDAIADFDDGTVCYVIKKCHKRSPRVFTARAILEDLGGDRDISTVVALLEGATSATITRNFKKPEVWPRYLAGAFREEAAVDRLATMAAPDDERETKKER